MGGGAGTTDVTAAYLPFSSRQSRSNHHWDTERSRNQNRGWTESQSKSKRSGPRNLHQRSDRRVPGRERWYDLTKFVGTVVEEFLGVVCIGRLKRGDQLVKANGVSLVGVSNEQ